LIVSDGDDHRRRRSVVAPGLRHRQIQDYVQTMVSTIDTVIDGWQPGQRLDIYQQCRSAVRRSTAESLFGQRIATHSDFLGEQLQPLLDLTHQLPQAMALQQRVNAPGWRRAMAARSRLNDFVDAQIAGARAAPGPDDHMMTMLINGRGEEGYALSDEEIRDSIISLITAGYETTSGALAWAIYTLLTLPGAWDNAADEVNRVLGDRPPAAADLDRLTYFNGVVHETLRLYSPGVISARRVMRDLWFDGHRIRAGRLLIFSAYVTHRLPELWPDPTEFRPARWDSDSPDYRKPAPHEFIPFSGGLHRCIGAVMATTEMTVMLARLVARTTLRLPAQRIRAANLAALAPRPGLTVDVIDSVPAQ
jgi:cytochrome P450